VTGGARAWVAGRVRSVVGTSVESGLDGVRDELRVAAARSDRILAALAAQEAAVAELRVRLEVVEHLARSIESEERAIRQQIEEALDFLRVQHFAVREALDALPGEGTEATGR
jgi:hypothetical protein